MNHAVRLLISFLFSLSAYATCPDAPTSVLECRGAKLVTNQSELDAYLQNFAENTTKGFIRGVRLRGNFSGTSQNIASPCKIIIDEATTLNFSEELCLISKDKVIARRGLNLFGKDVTLKAPNRVIIQDNATIDLSGDLTLHSHGPTEESRAHIRHSANVKVNNLTLRGLYRSTLGKESTYEAQGKISIFSTGEERPTDEDISEWSTVWRDTTIQANEFEARALWRVKVGTRTAINASKITLDGWGCKIGRDATLTALEKQGRCLLPNRPVARFKISPKEASIGESILLDGSRSQNAAAGESFRWRIDMPNGERIDTRKVEGPTYEFTPTQAGEHTIELRVYDQDGFHDWKKKKLIVRGSELFSYYKFELEEEKLSLIYEGRALSDERSIVEAFYTAPDGNRIDVGRRVLGHVDVIDSFDATEPVDLKLTVVDDLGTREEFTHTIEPRAEFQRPVLNFETIEYAPNELVFFSNFMFDPYNQLSDFDGFTLDFGDESSVEINAESFSTTHLYSSEGQYPAKIYAGDYENQKEITVTGSPSSFEFPLADFKVDGASWAPGVRLYVDQTISPASPIQSYLWRLGDGTTAYGPEVLHFYNEGAYDVSLTVILDNGTSSTVTREVIIMQTAPNLVGTVDCYDIGDKKAECHVEALDKLSDLKTLNINFGDNPQSIESTTVSGQWAEHTFIHSYEETGNYTVTMQALTNRGEEFFTTTEVAIGENPSNLPPVAILGCYPVYQDVICYSDSSYDPDGYITNYEYDFGDGTVINTTDTEVFHRFENTGTFTINLTVTDNFGVTASYPETVVIEEKPNEFPVPQLSCVSTAPQSLTCEGRNSYDPDGSIVSASLSVLETGEVYQVDNILNLEKTFVFSDSSDKTIILEVQDDQGAIVPLEKTYSLMAAVPPFVSFSCTSSEFGELSCDASSSTIGSGNSLISFDWLIEGNSYNGERINVSAIEETEVSVQLTITDDFGQSSSRSDIYTVLQNNPPVGDFSCDSTGPQRIECVANYSDAEGSVSSYVWSVDGNVFNGVSFNSTLSRGGEFQVSLIVTDNLGATTTHEKTVSVTENSVPVALINLDRNGKIAPATYSLSASNSNDADGSITSFEWVLEDGSIIHQNSISLEFLEAKQERVELIVTDNLGAKGHAFIDVVATDVVENEILLSLDQNNLPSTWTLEAFNKADIFGNSLEYQWKINGEVVSDEDLFNHTEEKEFLNYVSLTTKDIYGNEAVTELEVNLERPELYFTLSTSATYGFSGDTLKVQVLGLETLEDVGFTFDYSSSDIECNLLESEVLCQSSIAGEYKVKVIATLEGLSYSRDLTLTYGNEILTENVIVNENDYELFINGESLVSLSTDDERGVDISVAESNGTYIVSILSEEESDSPIILKGFSENYEVLISNVKQYYFSQLVDYRLASLPLDAIDGLNQVSVCPNVDKVRKVVDGIQKTFIFREKDNTKEYFANIFKKTTIGNQDFFMGPELVEDYKTGDIVNNYFNLDFSNHEELEFLKGLFKNPNPLVTLNGPVYILKKDIFRSLGISHSKTGVVPEGVGAIFLSSLSLEPANEHNKLGFYTHQFFVHENYHLREQVSDCGYLRDLEDTEVFSHHVINESLAQLEAINKALDVDSEKLGGISEKYNQLEFRGFVSGSMNINDSLKIYLTELDTIQNSNIPFQHYSYSLHLETLRSGNISPKAKIRSIIQSHEQTSEGKFNLFNYFENDPNYSNSILESLKTMPSETKYQNIGFNLEEASIEADGNNQEIPITKLGFGFIRVPYDKMSPHLMYSNSTFKMRVETNPDLKYSFFTNSNSSLNVTNTVDGVDTIHEIPLDPTKLEDVYIRIVNTKNANKKFKISAFEAFCLSDEGVFDSETKTCVRCNLGNGGFVENGQCLYMPQNILAGQYASKGYYGSVSSEFHFLEEVCLDTINSGSYNGAFAITEDYVIRWTCNNEERSVSKTRRQGTCIISPPGIINETIYSTHQSYRIDCDQPGTEAEVLYIAPASE